MIESCGAAHMRVFMVPGNCGTNCLDYNTDYLSWEAGGIGRFLVFLAIQGQIYFAILFLLESQVSIWALFYVCIMHVHE